MLGSVPLEVAGVVFAILLLGSLTCGIRTVVDEQQSWEQFTGLIALNIIISCLPASWPINTCFMVLVGQVLLYVCGAILTPAPKTKEQG